MKKQFFYKCFITLGLLLFFTLLIPFMSINVQTVQAASIDKEKNYDYRLNLKSITLVKDKSFTLKAYNLSEGTIVSFKSDDPEIASVNEDGTITANMVGFTTITATIKDDNNTPPLTCDITVGPPAFSVKITKSRIILGLDKTDLLRVILKPSNTAEVSRFSSYNSSIASISMGGRVTARKPGLTFVFAEIDATNSDGSRKFSICTVIVTAVDDAPLLESYFKEHPDLNMLSKAELTMALEEFFNEITNDDSNSNLVDALDQFLNSKFDLEALRAIQEEDVS